MRTYFDNHAEEYAENIMATQPTFYRNSGELLSRQLSSGDIVLDIGNGGVINYNHRELARLDCADLCVSQTAINKYHTEKHIHFMRTDVTNMTEMASDTYDVVILQALIHHLAGATLKETHRRVRAAISECCRVLKPGGKLLVMESTVKPWFNGVEKALYPIMELFFAICRFGYVYQFSPEGLCKLLSDMPGLQMQSSEPVDVGPHVWIMGKKIPTKITPCGVTFFVLKKDEHIPEGRVE